MRCGSITSTYGIAVVRVGAEGEQNTRHEVVALAAR